MRMRTLLAILLLASMGAVGWLLLGPPASRDAPTGDEEPSVWERALPDGPTDRAYRVEVVPHRVAVLQPGETLPPPAAGMGRDWRTRSITLPRGEGEPPGALLLEAISSHLYVRASTAADLAAIRALPLPVTEGEVDLVMALDWLREAGLEPEVEFPVLYLRRP
jgi:hypothetical protein